jgi:Ferritin-like domain
VRPLNAAAPRRPTTAARRPPTAAAPGSPTPAAGPPPIAAAPGPPAPADPRPSLSRRRALLAAAAAALAAPATARAARRGQGTVLLDLIGREQAAVSAYASAIAALGDSAPKELVAVHAQESAHADALATELSAVGFDRPRPPAPQGAAAQLAAATDAGAAVTAAAALEQELIAAYQAALPLLSEPKVATTAATILASHAQHALIAERRAGRDPLAAG